MKLSEMRDVLAREGIRLTKSLGQNFLHDANQLRKIVDAAELTKRDKVLEIGPGLGPLTELLLERAGEVLAIEKDERLVKLLRERFGVSQASSLSPYRKQMGTGEVPILSFLRGDALEILKSGELVELSASAEKSETGKIPVLRDWSEWKLVSNLPYSVASPILVELARGAHSPQRIVATLQLEVAKRLMAKPGEKDYGVLTLLVQLDFEPLHWFKIPAACFFPEPDVDSACVVLERRAKPLLPDERRETFKKIVKRAFSQRRKMMMKLLMQDWPKGKLETVFEEMKISPLERAEKLSLEQFVKLSKIL